MFATTVELYRALGRPIFGPDNSFEKVIDTNSLDLRLVRAAKELEHKYGSFDFNEDDAETVVVGRLPQGDGGNFYGSIDTFLKQANSLRRGNLPASFYVREFDYSNTDDLIPEQIKALTEVLVFIRLLAQFAEGEIDEETGGGHYKLIFVRLHDWPKPQRPLLLTIDLEPVVIKHQLTKMRLLKNLAHPGHDEKLHIEERRLVMKNAIAETLSEASSSENPFTHLVMQWPEVLTKYRHNLSAYLNEFSFDAVRKKIADADMEYATKFSSALGDISGKIFGLPLSAAAVIALSHTTKDRTFWFGFVGLTVTTLIFLLLLRHQAFLFARLNKSYDLVFSQYAKKAQTYPAPLKSAVEGRMKAHKRQNIWVRVTFWVFVVLSFSPFLGACYEALVRYDVNVPELVSNARVWVAAAWRKIWAIYLAFTNG